MFVSLMFFYIFNLNDRMFNLFLYLGKTSLMVAAENGNTDTVKMIIEHGADINTKDNDG